MKLNSKTLLLSASLAMGLAACGRDVVPAPAQPVTITPVQATSGPPGSLPGTSVPDAATVFAAQEAAARAKALEEAASALNKPVPATTMTKAEESKAMPLAGQANGHSSPARDDKSSHGPRP